MHVYLFRYIDEADEYGIPGILVTAGFRCCVLEPPWRRNQPFYSCIPQGRYSMKLGLTQNLIGGRRDLYLLEKVPGRSDIYLHAGTWAGDSKLGHKTDSQGCPLLGESFGTVDGQKGLLESRRAVNQFMRIMAGRSAQIVIKDI